MNYRHLVVVAAALAATHAPARQRTTTEIFEAATQMLGGGVRYVKGQSSGVSAGWHIVQRDEQLTLVACDGGGFALVANDDACAEAVVAYSASACDTANPALAWYIRSAEQALGAGALRQAPTVPAGDFAPSVEPLVASLWDQGTPFNDLCPLNAAGKPYPTGCVSTALSQLMYFHRYPTHGRGVKQYSFKADDRVGDVIEVDFGSTTYDWDHMLPTYDKSSTDEECLAVATLMYHTGVSVEMTYTSTGSGAYPSAAREGLIAHFAYNENIELAERPFYSTEEWMRMVYTELNAGRPILYGGSDKGYGGHAFVLDGYDTEGRVHVNWGWGPDGGNGYFDIALLDPGHYAFTESQHMLLGVTPQTVGEFRSHVVSSNAFVAQRLTKTMFSVTKDSRMYNNTGEVLNGELAIVLEATDADGNRTGDKQLLQTYAFSKAADRFYFTDNVGGVITLPKGLAEGTYRLYVGVKSTRDADWRLVRRPAGSVNSYLFTYAAGNYTLTPVTDDLWDSVLLADGVASTPHDEAGGITRVCDLGGRLMYSCPTPQFCIWDIPARGIFVVRDAHGARKVAR